MVTIVLGSEQDRSPIWFGIKPPVFAQTRATFLQRLSSYIA